MLKLLWNRFLLWKMLRELETVVQILEDQKAARLGTLIDKN